MLRRQSLFTKIALCVLLIFFLVSILLVNSIDNSARALQQEASQKLYLDLAKNLVKETPFWVEHGLDTQAVESALHTMMVLGPGTELYIVSDSGELLNYSDPDNEVVRTHIDIDPIKQLMQDQSILPVIGDDPRSLNGRKIFSVAPIYPQALSNEPAVNGDAAAYLYIIIGGIEYDSALAMLDSNHFVRLSLSTIVAGGIFLSFVLLLLYFFLTRPIRKLAIGLQEFQNSNFLELPASLGAGDPLKKDELNQLLVSINAMTRKIAEQFNALLKNKESREELFTHVSHDLRTPLASIRGYLESWQMNAQKNKDTDPAQYINIALKNCDQLEHLIEQVFELSRLDANELKPELENFPLTELIDDIVQKFTPQAASKTIRLFFSATETFPDVCADIGHTDRILSNLIENAIRHSKNESQIVIQLHLDNSRNKILVKVADSGEGIPAEDIPLLFEPYFRAGNQKQHYEQGTGLGLAISRRLLALVGSEISVESKLGVGSVFSFCLPCHGPMKQ